VIEAQRAALRELSTPLVPLADGVIAMPLIGTIDSVRAHEVMEKLLDGIISLRARTAILDITGVKVVDTMVADALLKVARAARLFGAHVILTGIGPDVARSLGQIGADLSGIVTLGTLQSGIAHALNQR
jgi:rsbT co-antagonist protein RsbR